MSIHVPISTHWGNYLLEIDGERVVGVQPTTGDHKPSPVADSMVGLQDARCRVSEPMVRASYLKGGPGHCRSQRGSDPFVAVSWDQATELVSKELIRVREEHGNEAIYAGSYGWGSVSKLHHAARQLQRFLGMFGGFTSSVNTYSIAAGEVLLPHVMGNMFVQMAEAPSWKEIAEGCELVVMFGGVNLKNSQMSFGGIFSHDAERSMRECLDANVEFVNVSPSRDDAPDFLKADWIPVLPHTDTALMLGLAHTLIIEGLHDKEFIERFCVGFERFLPYLMGSDDGQEKHAEWAASICQIPAGKIRTLARRMASKRSMISVNWAIQRAEYGEQPYWMATVLAALLGGIGAKGQGIAFGLNAMHGMGNHRRPAARWPGVEVGTNPVETFIPVARISDMLLNPGGAFQFDGKDLRYPDIKVVYWAGGNPFHHHQDLNKLLEAWRRPDTIIVNEWYWTATARHSDIVLPAATHGERNDLGFSVFDSSISPMPQALPRLGSAKTDFEIFAALAEALGFGEQFTEGRDEMEWLRHFYAGAVASATENELVLPTFDEFWAGGAFSLESPKPRTTFLSRFREDPVAFPLSTRSGKIEIFCEEIESFQYSDCGGHPRWIEPSDWLGAEKARRFPLQLLSNQPKHRLHSQFDHGVTSKKAKHRGREVARIHPVEAEARGIGEGDIVRIYNERGACLAAITLSEDLRVGILQLPTGAWYDPQERGQIGSLDVHGNPNVLTMDKGTSKLGQGPAANSTLVEVEKFDGELPAITVHDLPEIRSRD